MSQPGRPSGTTRLDPLEYFTDREELLSAFRTMLASAKAKRFELLAVKGNSGAGKSFLLRYLCERVCPGLGWMPVSITFSPYGVPSFRSILDQLEDTLCRSPFLPRDAIEAYRARRDQHVRTFDEYRTTVAVNQNMSAISGGSIDGTGQSVEISNQLHDRERHLRSELLRALSELCDVVTQPVCILVDGYERLAEADSELTAWLFEEALPRLAARSSHPITAIECGWHYPQTSNAAHNVWRCELQDFSETDIANYLRTRAVLGMDASIPVGSDQELVAACWEVTLGHPLFLDLACTYLLEFPELERTAERLRSARPLLDDEARVSYLTDRILNRLDEPYRQLLERGVVLRTFDKASLQALLPAGMDLSDSNYDRFLDYPFINRAADVEQFGRRSFHPLVRRVRLAALRHHHPDTLEKLQYAASTFYSGLIGPSSQDETDVTLELLYHGLQVPTLETSIFAAWDRICRGAISRWRAPQAAKALLVTQQLQNEGWQPVAPWQQAKLLINRSSFVARFETRWDEAIHLLEQCGDLYHNAGDLVSYAGVLNDMGYLYDRRGDLKNALESFQLSLSLLEEHEEPSRRAQLLNNIAHVYRRLGHVDDALRLQQQALDVTADTGTDDERAHLLSSMGSIFQERGEFDKALNFYGQSLELRRNAADESYRCLLLNNMAKAYQGMRQPHKALRYLRESRELAKKINNITPESVALSNIGGIYLQLGHVGKASRYLQESLLLKEIIGDKASLAVTLILMGCVHRRREQEPEACKLFDRARALAEEVGEPRLIAQANEALQATGA